MFKQRTAECPVLKDASTGLLAGSAAPACSVLKRRQRLHTIPRWDSPAPPPTATVGLSHAEYAVGRTSLHLSHQGQITPFAPPHGLSRAAKPRGEELCSGELPGGRAGQWGGVSRMWVLTLASLVGSCGIWAGYFSVRASVSSFATQECKYSQMDNTCEGKTC